MNSRPTLFLIGGMAGFACVISVVALLREPSPATAAALPEPAAPQLQKLESEIAALRAELARPKPALDPGADARPERAELAPGVPPEVLERLAALESTVAALQRQAQQVPGQAPKAAENAEVVREVQRTATDLARTEKERIAALSILRGKRIDGEDARSPDVVLGLLDIAERSQDEKSRVDVYRNMHGVKDPVLRDSMLRALANDPSVKVRMKCAEDLDTWVAEAAVQSALRRAADNDADTGVRAAALATLAGGR